MVFSSVGGEWVQQSGSPARTGKRAGPLLPFLLSSPVCRQESSHQKHNPIRPDSQGHGRGEYEYLLQLGSI